jgi:uncharacterized lipoprotein YddW (UPF0748 family)
MGKAPVPLWDPLAFAVEEAHRRGLELHAWFNPFRARHGSARSEVAESHLSRTRPELVKRYGRSLWMDPGEPAVRRHSTRVILDVVRRYDIDGVHLDDYFYPYRERDPATNRLLDFPDDASWRRYRRGGGRLSRDDWRRRNVDIFVRDLYRAVKAEKPRVKVGISPFGIWRPGTPPRITGFDPYTQIYADSRTWLTNGWLDYFAPQLYWPVAQRGQEYPVLLEWWAAQNARKRHLWPGNYTSRVDTGRTDWRPEEVLEQIRLTRAEPGATGNIHFSMRALMLDRAGVASRLTDGPYETPALVPASPWLDRTRPGRPTLRLARDSVSDVVVAQLAAGQGARVFRWVVRARAGDRWTIDVVPAWQTRIVLGGDATPDEVVVSAVGRTGNEGPRTTARP